jgi:hypothetical protein
MPFGWLFGASEARFVHVFLVIGLFPFEQLIKSSSVFSLQGQNFAGQAQPV